MQQQALLSSVSATYQFDARESNTPIVRYLMAVVALQLRSRKSRRHTLMCYACAFTSAYRIARC